MAEHMFFVEPLIASEAATRLLVAAKEMFPGKQVQQFQISTSFGNFELAQNIPLADLPQFEPCASMINDVKARPYLEVHGITLTLSPELILHYREDPQHARAEVKLSSNQKVYRDGKAFLPIVDVLHKQFTILRHSATIARLFPENEQRLLALSQRVIGDFAAQSARLAQINSQTIEDLHKAILEKTKELETVYANKVSELDAAHGERLKAVETRESAFQKEVEQFDLRDNTAVRRSLFAKLEKAIEKLDTVAITPETTKKRRVLHLICVAILALSAGGFWMFAHRIVNGAAPDWRLFLPLGTSLAVFATTAVFYIRWNNSWFYEHARAEFANRKLKGDMLRAGWVVEMFFEWDNKKQTPIPSELIASCTTGLFRNDSLEGARHPLDDLQALAKEFSKVRISKGGLELEKPESNEKHRKPETGS